MVLFLETSSWKRVERWLDQLDAWIQKEKMQSGPPNSVLGTHPQAWFSEGVAAINECLHPKTVYAFRDALQSRQANIDTVLDQLTKQDLAWQPDPNSTECISGPTIWRMVIATMAFRTNWDFGELVNREKVLTSFLGQWELDSSLELQAWHQQLCNTKPWAMSTTFDWLVERDAPKALQWVIEVHQEPSIRSMTRMVGFCLHKKEPLEATRWKQIQALRPELASYIGHYLLVHQQLTGENPDLSLGPGLAQSWMHRNTSPAAIAPGLFEAQT